MDFGGLFAFKNPDHAVKFAEFYFEYVDFLNRQGETFFINAAMKKTSFDPKKLDEEVKNPEIDSFGHISKKVFNYNSDRHILWICESSYLDSSDDIQRSFFPVPVVIDEGHKTLETNIYRYNPITTGLFVPKNPKILVLGAHCDDIELGCSGSIAYLRDYFNADIYYRVFSCMQVSPTGSKKPDFCGRGSQAIKSANLLLFGNIINDDESEKIAETFESKNNHTNQIYQNVEYLKDNKYLITNYYQDMDFDQSINILREELNYLKNEISPDFVIGPSLVDNH